MRRSLPATLSTLSCALVVGCGTPTTPAPPTASATAAVVAPSASVIASASAAPSVAVFGSLDWARELPESRSASNANSEATCGPPDEDDLVRCEQGNTIRCWKLVFRMGRLACKGAAEVERYRLWERLCETVADARGCAVLGEALTTRLPPPHERADKKRAVELLVAACDFARSPKGNRQDTIYACDRASYRLREAGDERWLAYAKVACAASSVAGCLRAMEVLTPAERLSALVDACDHPFSGHNEGDPVAACHEAALLARTPPLADQALSKRMMAAAKEGAIKCIQSGWEDSCPTLQKFPEADWPKRPPPDPNPTQPFWQVCRHTSEPHACAVALVDVFTTDEQMFDLGNVARYAMQTFPPIENAWWSARPWAFFARNTLAGWPAKSGESTELLFAHDPETALFTAKQACYIDDASCDTLADVLRATGGDVSAIDDANRRACAAGTARACTATKVP